MITKTYSDKFLRAFLSGLLVGLLAACQPAISDSKSADAAQFAKGKSTDNVEVSVDAVNYMHDHSVQFTLHDASDQPIGGAIVDILVGPGGKNCCTSLPTQWRPGLKYTLSWQEADTEKILPTKYEKTLELPRYSAPGDLYLLFYPNQEVELIASPVEPGHANWAGKVKTDQLSACTARLSEKECRKHLPKYRMGSREQSAAMIRAACQPTRIKESTDPIAEAEGCKSWPDECRKSWNIDKRMCDLDYTEKQ